jgi:DNA-binding transcriptional MerR regulator
LSENLHPDLDLGPAEIPGGIRTPDQLPDKMYFRIGEVARLTGLKQHVLRFWETEFPSIAPKKMGSNHRMYRRKDVELILEIKHLLYEKRFTIEGARKFLESRPKSVASPKATRKTLPVVSNQPMPKIQGGLFLVDNQDVAAEKTAKRVAGWRAELESIRSLLTS